MGDLLVASISWLGFLQRADVLKQLLAIGLALLLGRWLARLPWWGHLPPFAQVRRPPIPLVDEAALLLTIPLLAMAGQGSGLVLLVAQIKGAWLGLGLVEQHLLERWLGHEMRLRLSSRLLRPALLIATLLIGLDAVDNLQQLAIVPLGRLFGSVIDLGHFVQVMVVLYVLAVGSGPPASALSWLCQRGLGMGQGSRRALELILRYVLVSIGIVWALGDLGFNQTGLLAIAGGLSVGLGFGVKEVFSNFISGLWLLFEGSVRPGEVLIIDGEACEVRRLGLRAAVLWRRSDNAELLIPNQTFFTSTTATFTGSDRMRRGILMATVVSTIEPAVVLARLEEVATAQKGVLLQPAAKATIEQLGASTTSYKLTYWMADPLSIREVSSELKLALWSHFNPDDISLG
ncbi:MAG: mechanosensitive ion channel domain-containing protein [Synechococcus sp. ELA619]